MIKESHRVIVIGGGISGLSAAFWLRERGVNVLLLEKESRLGGLIRSESVGGYLLDHAANCIFNYLPEVNFLCNSAGLANEQIFRQDTAKKRYLVKKGRPTAVPTTIREFLSTDLWSIKGKLRLFLEPLVPRAAAGVEESVSQFISRRFGKEIFEQSIEPYVAGTLAGDAEKSCLQSTFQQFAAIEKEYGSILRGVIARKLKGVRTSCAAQVFSFRSGMESLTEALRIRMGESVISGASADGIERRGKEWLVTADLSGRKETFHADAVLLSTPAHESARLARPVSQTLGSLLGSISYSPMAVTFLGFSRKNVQHKLDGIGCLSPKKEKSVSMLGSLWSSTLFEGRAAEEDVLFTNYSGGARNPKALDKDDAELTHEVLNDLDRLVGLRGKPSLSKVIRHNRALPQYNLGHQMFLRRLEESLRLVPGLHITGNYLQGASVRVCIAQSKCTVDRMVMEMDRCDQRFSSRTTTKGMSQTA